MSSLLKRRYTTVAANNTRVIDTEELANRYIAKNTKEPEVIESDAFEEPGFSGFTANDFETIEIVPAADEAGDDFQEEAVIENPEEIAASIIEQAKADAEAILADAKAQGEMILNQSRDEGIKAAEATVNSMMHNLEVEYQRKNAELERLYEEQVSEAEPVMVDVITSVYEQVFGVDLKDYKKILVYVISNTLRKNNSGNSFVVHVSSEDYPFVSMSKKELDSIVSRNASLEIVEDAGLIKNQCEIETELGVFECGVSTQLKELTDKLRLLSFERN